MKKRLSVLFVVLAVAAIFASTVFAAPVNGKSVSLLSVDYNPGGVVLKFETSGLTQADLTGATFFADSNHQDIYCTFVGDSNTTVRCTAAKSLAGQGGFKVTMAGFTFWDDLPKEKITKLTCGAGDVLWYSVNQYINGEFYQSFTAPAWAWDEHEANGGFVKDALQGKTFERTGEFCAPDEKYT